MIGRLWYPQLDVYDTIRRMGGLISVWQSASTLSPERLYISDFYLANPPLLHKAHMSSQERKEFNALNISRPEKAFVSYPSPPILFQKMAEVQREAFRTISGKGLIDLDALERGHVRPSASGTEVFADQFLPLLSDQELSLAKFLTQTFGQNETEITKLRRSTGLRRMGR